MRTLISLSLLLTACGGAVAPITADEQLQSDSIQPIRPGIWARRAANPFATWEDGSDEPGEVCALNEDCAHGRLCLQVEGLDPALGRCSDPCEHSDECQSGCCTNAGTLGGGCFPAAMGFCK